MVLPVIFSPFKASAFGAAGRLIFFAYGMFSFIAGTILTIVGTKLCGEAFGWMDVVAGGFSLVVAAILLLLNPPN